MIASASAEEYRRAIGLVADDPSVDALIVIFIPPLVTRAEDVAAALARGGRRRSPAQHPVLSRVHVVRGVPRRAAD